MGRERIFGVPEDQLGPCILIEEQSQPPQYVHNSGHYQNEDNGEPELMLFKVYVYRMGRNERNGDDLLAHATASRSQTIKSVLDGVKGANPNQRCIVSSGKQFVTSLDPKDYYTTFANLRLRYPQAELTLI
jgi:hypothetical protein